MEVESFKYYLVVLAAIVIGIIAIKKITGCIFRVITTLIVLAVLAYVLHLLGYF